MSLAARFLVGGVEIKNDQSEASARLRRFSRTKKNLGTSSVRGGLQYSRAPKHIHTC